MLRLTLTSDERQAVERARRAAKTAPVVRARCQMVLLSADGWSPPRIARHLGYHPHTVRAVLHRFQDRGLVGLTPDPPGPAPDTSRREQVTTALDRLLAQPRTWTAAQLAAALGEEGIRLSTRQLRKYLRRLRARWRRTVRTLKHKQDPAKVARAQQTLAALKQGATAGRFTLAYLDEAGFAPSQPVNYSWTPPGTRKRIPYENPRSRRVNVLAAYTPVGPQPALTWGLQRGSLVSGQLVDFVQRIPRLEGKPLIVVLDNGSMHSSWVVKEALPELRKQRIYFYYLPSYSPELDDIEPVFGGIKQHDLPERSYTSWESLEEAICEGFTHAEERLLQRCANQLGKAA
jgi:transposase